jgi:hypothetical protein
MGMDTPKVIKDVGYTIGELNTTEQELVEAIDNLDCDHKTKLRFVRIIANKFNFARNIVSGQAWLERHGHIIVDRSENDDV